MNKQYLFFDTETTGLPLSWSAPLTDFANWPRLVQLAWSAYSADGVHIKSESAIVLPDGFEIPKAASDIHGITTERARREGESLLLVLKNFHDQILKADILIGHNISFDEKVVGVEFLRLDLPRITPPRKRVCTMLSSTRHCEIPSAGCGGFKWPKLTELHQKLFGCEFDGAHDAGFDVAATVKCFWKLEQLGVIKI